MRTALLGYTGFVGSNVLDQTPFDDLYNSKNIGDLRGQHYDLVVSAANRADSFRINTNGPADLAEVDELADTILAASISKLVLISTVCIYPGGGAPNEETALSPDGLTPYGQNRLHQERRLAAGLDTLIVRLPQLYGARLKKGVVYDLANEYRVEYIRPNAIFQHYDVRLLWRDIERALAAGLTTLNIATPPIANAQLALDVFGKDISAQVPPGPESPFASMYTRNMTTVHSELYGSTGPYIGDVESELEGIRTFLTDTNAKEPPGNHHV